MATYYLLIKDCRFTWRKWVWKAAPSTVSLPPCCQSPCPQSPAVSLPSWLCRLRWYKTCPSFPLTSGVCVCVCVVGRVGASFPVVWNPDVTFHWWSLGSAILLCRVLRSTLPHWVSLHKPWNASDPFCRPLTCFLHPAPYLEDQVSM